MVQIRSKIDLVTQVITTGHDLLLESAWAQVRPERDCKRADVSSPVCYNGLGSCLMCVHVLVHVNIPLCQVQNASATKPR
jgi:hypothetical protein